jgi:hypothetical protein
MPSPSDTAAKRPFVRLRGKDPVQRPAKWLNTDGLIGNPDPRPAKPADSSPPWVPAGRNSGAWHAPPEPELPLMRKPERPPERREAKPCAVIPPDAARPCTTLQ